MRLLLWRFSTSNVDTLGLLFVEYAWACFTLEDERRSEKVAGKTRIPAGTYPMSLRTEGGMHASYSQRFGQMHLGMLHLEDVPDFEWIYLHCGNDHEDTAGCPLLGDICHENITAEGRVASSERAYRRMYPVIARALARGEETWIEVRDNA